MDRVLLFFIGCAVVVVALLLYAMHLINDRGQPCSLPGMVRVSEYSSGHTICVAGIDRR